MRTSAHLPSPFRPTISERSRVPFHRSRCWGIGIPKRLRNKPVSKRKHVKVKVVLSQKEDPMEYAKLGNTGMDVSRICLGCMGFGDAEHWVHKWVLNEENSRPIIKKALELGINFFDTANVYSIGASEEFLGRALKDFAKRDEVVIATKVRGKMHDGPNGEGLSRRAILSEIDQSLKRLGTDYVDLYQIHRWDYQTPIEETMEALHDVVKAG